MKLSDVHSAKRLSIKLNYNDTSAGFCVGNLVHIEPDYQDRAVFRVSQYGKNVHAENAIICNATPKVSEYLLDLLEGEHANAYRCMFLIDAVEPGSVKVDSYTFRSMTRYSTTINIMVSEKLLEFPGLERLKQNYVWDQLGQPALFCLNQKSNKKQHDQIQFISGKRCLNAQNTSGGIIAEKLGYLNDKSELPIDAYFAPEINFVPISENVQINGALSADLEKISNPATYFARWEAYEALSKSALQKESEEFGEIYYSGFNFRMEPNGISFEFFTDQEVDDAFKGREVGASERETVAEQLGENARPKKQFAVGSIRRIVGKNVTTFLEGDDSIDQIPNTGVLRLYTAGNRTIMARREAARKRMINHYSPIRSIVALIEAGVSEFVAWGTDKPVTEELKRNFKRAADMNAEQLAALDAAINTPDIAIIQGPPGTGKTTVIKAIVERFREIYEAEQKQKQNQTEGYIIQSPKILISSFQNEAVDNAISAPLPGDIPAYRKTARRASESSKEQYRKSLEKWYSGLKKSITDNITDSAAASYVSDRRSLDDDFLSYKNAGEPAEKAAALINRYLSYVEIPYPKETVERARAIIASLVAASAEDDYQDPIVRRLEAQRTTIEAFGDDGERNARRLAAHIRLNDDLNIDAYIQEAIDAVCDEGYTQADFDAYVNAVNTLKKRFCRKKIHIDPKDKGTINECILTLANTFSAHYISTLSDMESKKSLILSEFLARMEQDYESIVKKYAMTTAATCQTCLDLHEETDKTYDLVIIDEAARANPLDLFIPMSMGRKIVLVGDHKQLPHMLEPDVLKMLKEKPEFKDIPEIEKSLFERLFEMFSGGHPRAKAIALTQQFRMHPSICNFVSESFYDGQLRTAKTITPEMKASPCEINDGKPLTFVNIPLSRGAETSGVSKSRWVEAEAIGKDVRHILDVDPSANIGVITFYSAQSKLISRHLDDILNDVERSHADVGTVDAFQGKEYDYVLLSCVRSNPPRDGKAPIVGFLEKPNRLCVAFSRSKRQLAVYGDVRTLKQIPCFSRLYDICVSEGGGCYREY